MSSPFRRPCATASRPIAPSVFASFNAVTVAAQLPMAALASCGFADAGVELITQRQACDESHVDIIANGVHAGIPPAPSAQENVELMKAVAAAQQARAGSELTLAEAGALTPLAAEPTPEVPAVPVAEAQQEPVGGTQFHFTPADPQTPGFSERPALGDCAYKNGIDLPIALAQVAENGGESQLQVGHFCFPPQKRPKLTSSAPQLEASSSEPAHLNTPLVHHSTPPTFHPTPPPRHPTLRHPTS